jgi:archaellum component FlaC
MGKNNDHPLPFFFPFLAILSFRKKKKGGEDLSGFGNDLDIPEGDTLQLGGLDSGLGGSLGGGLGGLDGGLGGGLGGLGGSDDLLGGLKGNDDKINEMNATIEDMKGQVETMQLQGKSVKNDMEQIKTDLGGINESMKSLLCIYEAVSKEFNPFVDNVVKKKAPAEEKLPLPVKEQKPEPKVPTLDLEEDEEPLDILMRPQDNYEAVIMNNQKAKRPEPAEMRQPAPELMELKMPEMRSEMRLPCMPEMTAASPYRADIYCMNQIYKLIEFHLDKIFIQKQKGIKVPEADFDALERWLKELRRMEVN